MIVSSILGSSVLTAAALLAAQPDPTRAPREAFTRCLFAFTEKAVEKRISASEFDTQFAQQCQAEETAFRNAIRTSAGRMPAAELEELQKMEVEDSRQNAKGRFEFASTPAT